MSDGATVGSALTATMTLGSSGEYHVRVDVHDLLTLEDGTANCSVQVSECTYNNCGACVLGQQECQNTGPGGCIGPPSIFQSCVMPPLPTIGFLDEFGLTAVSGSVSSGDRMTFGWTIGNAVSCTPTGGDANWPAGSVTIPAGLYLTDSLTSPTTFTITCQNSAGDSYTSGFPVGITGGGPGTCTIDGDCPVNCIYGICSSVARVQCNNEIDDDGDGLIDYSSFANPAGSDPECSSASDNLEAAVPVTCTSFTYTWAPDPCTTGSTQTPTQTIGYPAGCTGGSPLASRICPTLPGCTPACTLPQTCGGGGTPGICGVPGGTTCPDGLCNPLGDQTLLGFLLGALRALVNILIPIIVLVYIIIGLMFILARGAPEKLKIAKIAFLYTSIGAGIVLGAWVLTELVRDTIGAITA